MLKKLYTQNSKTQEISNDTHPTRQTNKLGSEKNRWIMILAPKWQQQELLKKTRWHNNKLETWGEERQKSSKYEHVVEKNQRALLKVSKTDQNKASNTAKFLKNCSVVNEDFSCKKIGEKHVKKSKKWQKMVRKSIAYLYEMKTAEKQRKRIFTWKPSWFWHQIAVQHKRSSPSKAGRE